MPYDRRGDDHRPIPREQENLTQVEDIIAKARAATGLSDLGDPSAREGLERLVLASNQEARLSEVGAQRWEANLVDTLANRLRIVDHLARHPELLERPVDRPLFVFGLPRTGTTLTINLLSADPARRCLMRWEALHSAPPANAGELRSDPRCLAERKKLEMSIKYMPQIAAIHYEDHRVRRSTPGRWCAPRERRARDRPRHLARFQSILA
jgi:hypothetical protein